MRRRSHLDAVRERHLHASRRPEHTSDAHLGDETATRTATRARRPERRPGREWPAVAWQAARHGSRGRAHRRPARPGGRVRRRLPRRPARSWPRTPGCRSVRMTRGIESPSRFVLLVEWDSVEAHLENFRASERFGQWRAHIGPLLRGPASGGALRRRAGLSASLASRWLRSAPLTRPDSGASRPDRDVRRRRRGDRRPATTRARGPGLRGRARLHRLVAATGRTPGRGRAVAVSAAWSASTSAATARSGGHSTVGDREVLDLRAAVDVGPTSWVRPHRHRRLLHGRRGRGTSRRAVRRARWPPSRRSAGPAGGTTAARCRCAGPTG